VLKVLLIYYEPIPAGQTTHVLALARGLKARGHHITLVLPADLQRSIERFEQANVDVVPLALRKVTWHPRAVADLIRLIQRRDFDVVHVHSQEAGLPGRVVASMAGSRSVVYTPQVVDIRRVRWHWLYVLIERLLAQITDVIISVSESDRSRMIRWGIPSHRIATIPNGIDLSAFEESVDVGGLRRAMGLEEGRFVVMQVGRLSPQKDPLAFVEGAALVARERPDAQFVLVGEGPLAGVVAERAQVLGLDGSVCLSGWRDEAFRLMAGADVISLTSRWEGMPHVLLEAMACSRPVVSTAVNGCPEVVADGETGFLVPPGDVGSWAERVVDLLNDPARGEEMGRRGRDRVEEQFSLQKMVTRIEDLYLRVAGAG
jgi:glycosyltransferase involved in cell wall biosynthesis